VVVPKRLREQLLDQRRKQKSLVENPLLKVFEGVWGCARVSPAKPCRSNGTLRCFSQKVSPQKMPRKKNHKKRGQSLFFVGRMIFKTAAECAGS
jgi:hypothetical protein